MTRSEEWIETEIKKCMSMLVTDRMPISAELRTLKRGDLESAISQNGGFIYWAGKLGLKMKDKSRKELRTDNEIENEIREVMRILCIERMPTSTEVRSFGCSGLESSISKTGGYDVWRLKLGLSHKRDSPDEDKLSEIENKINEITCHLNIDRMPTSSEIRECKDGDSLHNLITRNGGYRFWAEKLNLELKESETKIGQDFELVAKSILESKGFEVEKMSTKHPFDLLVNDLVKVDVKVGNPYLLRGSRCHTFGLSKQYASCDIYLIFALEESGEVERTLVIPSQFARVVTLSIGENSKYNRYIDEFDYISKYSKFLSGIK